MLEGSNTAVLFPPPLGLSQVPCSFVLHFYLYYYNAFLGHLIACFGKNSVAIWATIGKFFDFY